MSIPKISRPVLIHGCTGLGDQVYHWPVVKYFLDQGRRVFVAGYHPLMFSSLPKATPVSQSEVANSRSYDTVDCNYFPRKMLTGTNQYQDCLIQAKVPLDLPYRYEVTGKSRIGVDLKNKKLCLMKHPDYNRLGGTLRELIPNLRLFQQIIDKFKDQFIFALVGYRTDTFYGLKNFDYNLIDKTTVHDLQYLIERSSMIVTRTGHLLPMAEARGKKCFTILSAKAEHSKDKVVSTITPEKIKCAPCSYIIKDDDQNFMDKFNEYCID